MHELDVLRDLVLIVGLAIPVVALTHRFRIPPLVVFVLVGGVIGPGGVALIGEVEAVEALAEIGVVLLLFEVGLELSLSEVLRWGRSVLVGGGLQVAGTLALTAGGGLAAGLPPRQCLFYGGLVALSSTAIVSKTYADRGELDSAHGREAIAILLFQDLAVVPLMLFLPVLAGGAAAEAGGWSAVVLGLAVMGVLVVGGRWVVRWALDRIVETRNRELFTLCVAFFGIGTAVASAWAGFSLALGAFLAGLIISESDYGLQAISDVRPFRALFSGVFFTSIGMLVDPAVLMAEAPVLVGMAALVVVVKAVVAASAVVARGRPVETAVAAGLSLAQIGEFSFVLAAAGAPLGLFGADHYQRFLVVTALSMMVTPLLIGVAGGVAVRLVSRTGAGGAPMAAPATRREDHAVVVGYGLAGRYLGRMLRAAGIECVVIDQNAALVARARNDGLDAVFGDGTRHALLEHAGAARARLVVFAISSPLEERRGVATAREAAPHAAIVVRTRYIRAIDELMRLGATEVVVEEFEASLELFARALESYQIPPARIAHRLEAVRHEHYGLLRGRTAPDLGLDALAHLGIHAALELVEVEAGAAAVGGSATSLDLRRATGAVQVAVIREGRALYQRDADFAYRVGDTAVLVGDREALDRAARLFGGASSPW